MDLTDKTWEEIISQIITTLLEKGLVGWFIFVGILGFSLGFGIMLLHCRKIKKSYEEKLTRVNQTLDDCSKTLSTTKTDLANSKNTLFQTQQELTTCKKDLSETNQKLLDCKESLIKTKQELDVSKAAVSKLGQDLAKSEKEIASLKHLESYLYVESVYQPDFDSLSDPALDSFIKPEEPVHA